MFYPPERRGQPGRDALLRRTRMQGTTGLFGGRTRSKQAGRERSPAGCPPGGGAAPCPQGSGAHPALSPCHAPLLPAQPPPAAEPRLPVLDWQPAVISQDRRARRVQQPMEAGTGVLAWRWQPDAWQDVAAGRGHGRAGDRSCQTQPSLLPVPAARYHGDGQSQGGSKRRKSQERFWRGF